MSDNIIAVNVPNFVSITIMAFVGLFVASLLLKWAGSRGSNEAA